MQKIDSLSRFHMQLREAGQRATPARLAILAVLEKTKKPLSVEKINQKLGDKKIDYVTVYRTVNILKEIGIVRQIDLHHGHAHYELAALGDHHHVVCMKCDRIEDVDNCSVEADMYDKALQQSGFASIAQHSLEFFGLCQQCST